MSADNYSFDQTDQRERKYQLAPNDLYDYPATTSIQPLETCPLTSEIKVTNAPWSSGDRYVFDVKFGRQQFVSNCFKFHFTVPLTVTLAADAAEDITAVNFMNTVFNNNADICYSQFSALQAILNIGISANDSALTTINNVAETFNMIAPYYASSDVDEYFHASQPDRFQTFEAYTGGTNQIVEYFDVMGNAVTSSVNPVNDANIFGSTYQKGYVSRTPQWTFVSTGSNARRIANVKCSFYCYLPLSIGTVPSLMTALSGLHRLEFGVNMKSDVPSHIFNIKKTGGVYRYASIVTDLTEYAKSEAKLATQVYSAPQYMRDKMLTPLNTMQPYSISYPRITTVLCDTHTLAAGASTSFNRSDITSSTVPSSIYIGLCKIKKGTFQQCASTPINFGLIKNLNVRVESASTNFNSILALDYLTDSNSYDGMDPIGKMIKGFPIRLKVGKDISLPGDLIIGQSYNFTLAVDGNFVNQGVDAAEYRLIVVLVNEATLDFDGTNFSLSSGVLVPPEMLSDQYFLKNQYSAYQRKVEVMGGGVFGDAFKWLGKNAVNLAKNAWENRDKIASTIGDVVKLAKTVRGGKAYSNVSGGSDIKTMGAGAVKKTIFR